MGSFIARAKAAACGRGLVSWEGPTLNAAPLSSHAEVIALLSCAYVVAFIDRGLVATVGAPLQHDLHLSDAQFGMLSGPAFAAFFCLSGIPLGWLADRTSRRAVIAGGMCIWSLMTGACALSNSFGDFFAARLGVGLGEACLIPAALSLIRTATPSGELARAVAIFLMGATLGNAIALIGGGQIIGHVRLTLNEIPGLVGFTPWRALFSLAAVPGIVLAAFIMRLRVPPREASSASLPGALRDATRLLRVHRSAYGWLTASTACIIALSQTPTAWMPLWYVRRYGLSAAQSATLVGLLFLISAPTGQWFGGVLIDRMRSRGVTPAPQLLQAGCALLCLPLLWGFCSSSSLSGSATSYAIFNVLVFAATPAGMIGWQWLTPQRAQGLVIALLVAAVTLAGIGLGPPAVGILSDHVGTLGRALFVILVSAAVIGASCALLGIPAFLKATEQVGRRAGADRAAATPTSGHAQESA
jgi:MFS family permease